MCTALEILHDRIITQLEHGIVPWEKCYRLRGYGCAVSHSTNEPYSLVNQFLLGEPGEYYTFGQIQKCKYRIHRGAKAGKVVFWKVCRFEDKGNADEEQKIKNVPILKWFNVFHEADIDGIPPRSMDGDEAKNAQSIIPADEIISRFQSANPDIEMQEADCMPCFIPSRKLLRIPRKCQFDCVEAYYHTIFHEMVHATKFALGRELSNGNKEKYSREELVAEIGAAYLCGACGISSDKIIDSSASYCASWLEPLKRNTSWILWASSRAEAAAKYILGEDNSSKDSEE